MSYRNTKSVCKNHGLAHSGHTTNDLGFEVCNTCGAGLVEKAFYCPTLASHKGQNTVTGECEVCGSDLKFTNMKPEILVSSMGEACVALNDVNNQFTTINQTDLTES